MQPATGKQRSPRLFLPPVFVPPWITDSPVLFNDLAALRNFDARID